MSRLPGFVLVCCCCLFVFCCCCFFVVVVVVVVVFVCFFGGCCGGVTLFLYIDFLSKISKRYLSYRLETWSAWSNLDD